MSRRERAARAASLVPRHALSDATVSRSATSVNRLPPARASRLARLVLAATGVGVVTGVVGVGGGFAIVPALVLVLGYSMPVAVGTSLLVISLNSASALTIRAASGALADIDWLVIGSFTLVAALGSLSLIPLSEPTRPS